MPCAFHLKRPIPFLDLGPGCQFTSVSEDELIEFAEKKWCRFHLPLADDAGGASPKAGWDEAQVEEFNRDVFRIIDAAREANETADLSGVVFPGEMSFKRYRQSDTLPPELCLAGADLTRGGNFRDVEFPDYCRFDGARFGDGARFHGATFGDFAGFKGATFGDNASFEGATFGVMPQFGGATFGDWAKFLGTTFSAVAEFNGATFGECALFGGAMFGGGARFDGATFGDLADFSASRAVTSAGGGGQEEERDSFEGISFSATTFSGSVSFANRRFLDETSFDGTRFCGVPSFHNAMLHQDTDFTDAVFEDTTSADAARAYRTLKLAMETHRAHDEQAMFFALEQRSKRHDENTPTSVRWISRLYEFFSDYGRSFTLPAAWLWFTACVSFAVYAFVAQGHAAPGLGDVVTLTVQQVVRPFFIWSATYNAHAWVAENLLLLRLLASLQSLLSFAFIALSVLALRWRFRRG